MQTRPTFGPLFFIILTALVLAGVVVFLALRPGMDNEALVLVPVEFNGLAEDLIIASASTDSIEIQVKGPTRRLENLKTLTIPLSLETSRTGDTHIPVTPDQLTLPQGIRVISMKPMSVRVTLDRKIDRELPVDIITSGTPAKGYKLVSALAVPPTVMVAGPEGLVETLAKIRTKPVDISGLTESCKKEAVFDTDPFQAVVLPQEPVIAHISLEPNRIMKKIDVPLTLPSTGVSVNPTTASLEISGPENRFNSLDLQKDIQISIASDDLKPGVYVRRATISLPVDFTLVSVRPELFTLTVD